MDYVMNILYSDSNILLGEIHRIVVYVFLWATCRYRHGRYCEKEIHNKSGLENTPIAKILPLNYKFQFELFNTYLEDSLLE